MFAFTELVKHVRFLSDRISFFPTSEETHNFIYRISRSISRVFETQNSSQKIDLDLYPGHKKYCPGVDYFLLFSHVYNICFERKCCKIELKCNIW